MHKVTAIIVTFNRNDQLKNLLRSLKKYYPDMHAIVVDNGDGKNKYRTYNKRYVDYHKIPFDSGLSYSRNYALDLVKTEYFLLLDDDFIFTERTDVKKLLRVAQKGFDVVGGAVEGLEYNGILRKNDNVLEYIKADYGTFDGFPIYDMVLNFFIARTDSIRDIRWDNELKLAEHTDFFLRAQGKLKITFLPDVIVEHDHQKSPEYLVYRRRARMFMDLFMRKHGIDRIKNFSGVEMWREGIDRDRQEKNTVCKKKNIPGVDFLVTTFKRQKALERLMLSIAEHYPMAHIYIADQNETIDRSFYRDLNMKLAQAGLVKRPRVDKLPYDCGVSFARNHLFMNTPGKYKLILDDDMRFTEKTDIGKMVKLIEADEATYIVGGALTQLGTDVHFEFSLDMKDDTISQMPDNSQWREHEGIRYRNPGCVLNFALMRKDIMRYIQWDPELKVCEHMDFYLRLRNIASNKTIVYTPDVVIDHPPAERDNEYKALRQRDEFLKKMFYKHGARRVKYLNGQITELQRDGSLKRYKEVDNVNTK